MVLEEEGINLELTIGGMASMAAVLAGFREVDSGTMLPCMKHGID